MTVRRVRGEFWCDAFAGRSDEKRFVAFVKNFMRGRAHPMFLVMECHAAQRGCLVSEFIESLKARLELQFLPGCASGLDPDELVRSDLEKEGVSGKPLREAQAVRERVPQDPEKTRRRPALIRSPSRASRGLC